MAKATGKLLYGVGINDADYVVQINETIGFKEDGKKLTKVVWRCPFHRKWSCMLQRCYSDKFHSNRPAYADCTVSPEWLRFTNFRRWMEKQDWEGKELDKDLLFISNKIYSPDYCVFIEDRINQFLKDNTKSRGEWPIGVFINNETGKFIASGRCVQSGKKVSLGSFTEPSTAHQAWLAFKLSQAHILAADQSDPRVAAALIDRYENYHIYFPQPR